MKCLCVMVVMVGAAAFFWGLNAHAAPETVSRTSDGGVISLER